MITLIVIAVAVPIVESSWYRNVTTRNGEQSSSYQSSTESVQKKMGVTVALFKRKATDYF
jgi:hypothetical protein